MAINLSLTTHYEFSELADDLMSSNNFEDIISLIKHLDACAADYEFTSALHDYFKTEMAKEDALEMEDNND